MSQAYHLRLVSHGLQIEEQGELVQEVGAMEQGLNIPSKTEPSIRINLWQKLGLILIFRNLILTLGAKYSLGLQPVQKFDVTYQINDQTYKGTVDSKGSGWKFDLGLKIPLYSGNK